MRFALYRFVSVILQVIAWLSLLVGIVVAIVVVSSPGDWMQPYMRNMYMWDLSASGMRWGMFAVWLIGGIITWACFLGFAGILHLLVAIEGNTASAKQVSSQALISGPALGCPACHSPIHEGDKFCQRCGTKIGD